MTAIGPSSVVIGCCICLNTGESRTPATMIIKGYSVCDRHADHLTGDYSDFAALIRRIAADPTRDGAL